MADPSIPAWTIVSAEAPLRLFEGQAFVAALRGSPDVYAFTVTSRETRLRSYQAEREVHLRYAPLGSDEPSTLLRLPARRSFDDIVLQHLHRHRPCPLRARHHLER